MDEAAVLRAAEGLALSLPRAPQRGRTGARRAAAVGSSVELHDWRAYQPGDDVRAVDWNAVARTGELIIRLREDEVYPRVEVVLDASRSMALTTGKGARSQELAALMCVLAQRQGLAASLTVPGLRPEQAEGSGCRELARRTAFEATDDLGDALRRSPPLRRCGLRVVVSDFLFDAPLEGMVALLARGASALALVQVLADEEVSPPTGFGARLVDTESGEVLEHLLTPELIERYLTRFEAHRRLLLAAARRTRSLLFSIQAETNLEVLARERLYPLVTPVRAEAPWP